MTGLSGMRQVFGGRRTTIRPPACILPVMVQSTRTSVETPGVFSYEFQPAAHVSAPAVIMSVATFVGPSIRFPFAKKVRSSRHAHRRWRHNVLDFEHNLVVSRYFSSSSAHRECSGLRIPTSRHRESIIRCLRAHGLSLANAVTCRCSAAVPVRANCRRYRVSRLRA